MHYLVLLTFFLAAAAQSAPTPKGRITLEEAKRYAISNNFEILSLRNAVKEAKAKESKAKAPFYPTLGVMGGPEFENTTAGDQTIGMGLIYAQYNLFRGFGDKHRLNATQKGSAIADIRLKKAEFRVGVDVEAAFHQYLFQKGAISIQKKALELNKVHKKRAKKRKQSGLVSNSDVMEFDIEESLLNSELVSLKQQLEIARIQLKKLLGQEIGATIEPVGELQHQHLEGTLMEYLNRIKSENENILVLTEEVEKAEYEKKAASSNFFPEIDVQVRAGYENLHDRPAQGGAVVGGMLIAKIELFSGFETLSERKEKAANLFKQEARLKQAILDSVTDTERTYRQIKAIQQRVDLEEKNEEKARKFYRSVLSEYKRGVKNSSDVKGAAELYIESILRREKFKYDFLVEKLNLERIIGGPVKVSVVADNHN